MNGTNTNINIGATPYSQYAIVGTTASFSIEGIGNVGALADGQIVRLINATDQLMTIVNSNTEGLKTVCPSDTNLLLPGKNSSGNLAI